MSRETLFLKYKSYFLNQYIKCMQELNLDEQIHFTDTLIKVCFHVLKEDEVFIIDDLIEQELFIKYRSKMKYFLTSNFTEHFIYESNGFKTFSAELKLSDDPLSKQEHTELIIEMYATFEHLKKRLYILDKTSNGFSTKDMTEEEFLQTPSLQKKFKTYNTRSQQVLMMHYLNVALQIKPKSGIPITNIAKFYNALFGWEYSDINNSTLYKHFKKDPFAKHNKKELHEQLLWVREQFALIGLEDIVGKITEKIKEIENNPF